MNFAALFGSQRVSSRGRKKERYFCVFIGGVAQGRTGLWSP